MLNLFKNRKTKKQVEYLKEMRPLPLGVKEFEKWSLEIIRLADIPGLTIESGQFALSEMILHVKPTQSFESYGHFVHSLRKGAANQVAHGIFTELKNARIAQDKVDKGLKEHEVQLVAAQTTTNAREENLRRHDQKVLANPKV